MRGITDLLRCTFYPLYTYKNATNGPIACAHRRNKPGGSRGKALGNRVDRELVYYCKNRRLPTYCTSETTLLVKYLQESNLELIACQFPVADEMTKICTNIDVIVQQPDGVYLLLEIKTGYDTYKRRYANYMASPFELLNDCPLHQHHLQLLVTSLLFRRSFPHIIFKACVWYLYPSEILQHPLLEDVEKHATGLFKKLEESKQISRKQRRKGRKRTRDEFETT